MERASIHLLWRLSDAVGRWTARNYLAADRRGPDWKQRALRCRLEASNSLSNQQPRESIVSRPGSCPAVKLPPLFSGVARIENRITIQIGQLKRHVTKLVGSPSQVNERAPNQTDRSMAHECLGCRPQEGWAVGSIPKGLHLSA